MLTPHQLAHEIQSDVMAKEDEIADAIEALIKQEREACAKIAEYTARGLAGESIAIEVRDVILARRLVYDEKEQEKKT